MSTKQVPKPADQEPDQGPAQPLETPPADDPNIVYPYKNPDGTPIRAWWIKMRPLYTYPMQLRVQTASNKQVNGAWVQDEQEMTYASIVEMVESYRLPDFTRPGEELPPFSREVFETMPVYFISVMNAEAARRTGMDLSAWTTQIAGKEADFR